MSKDKDNTQYFLFFIFFLAIIAHHFLMGPFIAAKLFNWYLADLFHTTVSWHNMYGLGLLLGYYLMNVSKKELEDEPLSDKVSHMLGQALAMWLIFGFGYMFQGISGLGV